MGLRRWVIGLCAGLALLGAARGWAAEQAPSTEQSAVALSGELVSVHRMPGLAMDQDAFPSHTTIITAEEIRRSGVTNLPDLLRRQAGVTVLDSRGFGLGADSGVNLRGVGNSSRSDVLVLVDGIRRNRITGDEVHWQSIPMSQIERIEILRGGGGTIYGEGALAGVINITMKSGGERPIQTEERVEVGSYGWQQYTASYFGRAKALTYATSVTRHFLDGYRDSTGLRESTLTANVGLDVTDRVRLRLTTLHSADTSHFAGGLTPSQVKQDRRNPGAFNGFFDDETTQVGFEQEWRGPAGLSTLMTGFWRKRNDDSVTTSRFMDNTTSRGVGMRLAHEAGDARLGHTLLGGVELGADKATTGTHGSSALSESNRANIGLYAEETVRLLERLTLVGGYRYDHVRFDEGLTFPVYNGTLRFSGRSPKIGLTLRATDHVAVYANYARAFKAPNIDDLDAVLPPFQDNVAVRPQSADHIELGLRVHPAPWLRVETAWFTTFIKREILFNPFTFANDNFNTRREGLELSATGELLAPSLTYYINSSITKAHFTKGAFNGYVIPATPEYLVNAGLTYAVIKGLRAGVDWEVVNTQFRVNDLNNQLQGTNYGVLNAHVQYDRDWLSIYLTINNITDARYSTFQSSSGSGVSTGENPMPPTNWVLGMALRF